MTKDKIVQFVCFETTLDKEDFITEWEQFTRSANTDDDVTIQQSERKGKFSYIAQHRSASGDFHFLFNKARTSSRFPEVAIKVKPVGGYSLLYSEKMDNFGSSQRKVFIFLPGTQNDLDVYKQLPHVKLNIYEAYYENCHYTNILEYFVKDKYVPQLMEQLRRYTSEAEIYQECALHPA